MAFPPPHFHIFVFQDFVCHEDTSFFLSDHEDTWNKLTLRFEPTRPGYDVRPNFLRSDQSCKIDPLEFLFPRTSLQFSSIIAATTNSSPIPRSEIQKPTKEQSTRIKHATTTTAVPNLQNSSCVFRPRRPCQLGALPSPHLSPPSLH